MGPLQADGMTGGADDPETPDSMAILQDVALDLFSSRGFHAVTIKDIAAATGLNTSLIYYYFGSKEDSVALLLLAN